MKIKIISFIKKRGRFLIGFFSYLATSSVFAGSPGSGADPFPTIDVGNGDVVTAIGTHMETSMQYAMIGGGIVMLLVGMGVIMHRLREDSANKDTGSFLTTLIVSGLAITVGIILIAIGWAAAGYQPGS